MTNLRNGSLQPNPNVQNPDILHITIALINRMKVTGRAENTITSYVRAVERLVRFHGLIHPRDLDVDEILDFLVSLPGKNQINWRTINVHGNLKLIFQFCL